MRTYILITFFYLISGAVVGQIKTIQNGEFKERKLIQQVKGKSYISESPNTLIKFGDLFICADELGNVNILDDAGQILDSLYFDAMIRTVFTGEKGVFFVLVDRKLIKYKYDFIFKKTISLLSSSIEHTCDKIAYDISSKYIYYFAEDNANDYSIFFYDSNLNYKKKIKYGKSFITHNLVDRSIIVVEDPVTIKRINIDNSTYSTQRIPLIKDSENSFCRVNNDYLMKVTEANMLYVFSFDREQDSLKHIMSLKLEETIDPSQIYLADSCILLFTISGKIYSLILQQYLDVQSKTRLHLTQSLALSFVTLLTTAQDSFTTLFKDTKLPVGTNCGSISLRRSFLPFCFLMNFSMVTVSSLVGAASKRATIFQSENLPVYFSSGLLLCCASLSSGFSSCRLCI